MNIHVERFLLGMFVVGCAGFVVLVLCLMGMFLPWWVYAGIFACIMMYGIGWVVSEP